MSGSVSSWITELSEGDDRAATELYNRFWIRLRRRVLRARRKRPSIELDPDDIAQSVFHRVIRQISDGKSPGVRDRHRLWRFFEVSLVNKLIDVSRKARIRRSLQLREAIPLESLSDDRPPPDFFAEFVDEVDYLARVLDHDARSIVLLAQQGFQTSEIARSLDISQRTVQRKLALIEDVWSGFGSEESAEIDVSRETPPENDH